MSIFCSVASAMAYGDRGSRKKKSERGERNDEGKDGKARIEDEE